MERTCGNRERRQRLVKNSVGLIAAVTRANLSPTTEILTLNPKKLKLATEIVKANNAHVLNKSKEYRQARDALLAKKIKLRRHIVQVAE